jgi:hypothetical protein
LAGAFAAAPAAAVTYDAFSSFVAVNGVNQFYYVRFKNGVAPALNTPGTCVIAGTICLQGGNSDVPGVYKTQGGAFTTGTVKVPADALIVHPGIDSSVEALFRPNAPGRYRIEASFFQTDTNPNAVAISPFFLPLGGPSVVDPYTLLTTASPSFSFSRVVTFGAGDLFGFDVNNAGNYFNDSTGMRFSATFIPGVPEPAAWGMMLIGFAAIGVAARRSAAPRAA